MQKNLSMLISLLSIAGITIIFNPPAAVAANDVEATATAYCGKKPSQSCRDFASVLDWVLQTGDLRPNEYADRRAQELKLPGNGAFAKAHGAPDNPDKIERIFDVMFDKDPVTPGAKPVCVVMYMYFPPEGNVGRESYIRFRLDGKAETAVDSEGKHDEQGNPIKGSAVYHELKLKKPEVKARIEHELAFWIKHTKEMTAKEAAEAAAHKTIDPASAAPATKDAPAGSSRK